MPYRETGSRTAGTSSGRFLPGLADADRIFASFVVDRDELDVFSAVFGEDDRLPRGVVAGGEPVLIFKDSLRLDLDSAVLPIAKLNFDLQPPIRESLLLDAGISERVL